MVIEEGDGGEVVAVMDGGKDARVDERKEVEVVVFRGG